MTQAFILNVYSKPATEAVLETAQYGWGSLLMDLIFALLFAWVGYLIVKWIFGKIFNENNKLNGENKEIETKTAVVIDGNETTVDMSIDGAPVVNEDETYSEVENKKTEKISKSVMFMFILGGLYLVGNWILYTVYGFLI